MHRGATLGHLECLRRLSVGSSAFWIAEFGGFRQLEVDRWNPDIIRAYYFESIDMTLIVNVLKDEIDIWVDGRAYH